MSLFINGVHSHYYIFLEQLYYIFLKKKMQYNLLINNIKLTTVMFKLLDNCFTFRHDDAGYFVRITELKHVKWSRAVHVKSYLYHSFYYHLISLKASFSATYFNYLFFAC